MLDQVESEVLLIGGANSVANKWVLRASESPNTSEKETLMWSGKEFQILGAATLNASTPMLVLARMQVWLYQACQVGRRDVLK